MSDPEKGELFREAVKEEVRAESVAEYKRKGYNEEQVELGRMTPEEITAWARGWSESGGPDRLGMEVRFDAQSEIRGTEPGSKIGDLFSKPKFDSNLKMLEQEALQIGYGTQENRDVRLWYLEGEARIPELIDDTMPLKIQAKQAVKLRNHVRTLSRELMRDRALAKRLNSTDRNLSWWRVYRKYYNRGFRGDDLYREIIKSAQRSRDAVNRYLDIGGKN